MFPNKPVKTSVKDKNKTRALFQDMEATHVSQYFQHQYDKNEQKTIQSLTDESIVISGYMCYYVFRTKMTVDEILAEPSTSTFDEAFQIAVTFPDYVMGWNNADPLLSKFGFSVNPESEFIMSQRAWDKIQEERKAQGLYTFFKPREGDLLVFYGAQRWEEPKEQGVYYQNKTVFQITYVNEGKNSWQWGKDYVWRVNASVYKYDESENLSAQDDFGKALFDLVPDFNRPKQNDTFTEKEKDIRNTEEVYNPFDQF